MNDVQSIDQYPRYAFDNTWRQIVLIEWWKKFCALHMLPHVSADELYHDMPDDHPQRDTVLMFWLHWDFVVSMGDAEWHDTHIAPTE